MKKCCRDFVFAFCCILAMAFGGCGGYKHATIPEVDVNFTIYPNDAAYAALNHIGGYMYFTGGVAGIVVYRLDSGTFLAYDRACPSISCSSRLSSRNTKG